MLVAKFIFSTSLSTVPKGDLFALFAAIIMEIDLVVENRKVFDNQSMDHNKIYNEVIVYLWKEYK